MLPLLLTEEVGVLEDVQLAVEVAAGEVELLGLPLQVAQLVAGLVVVVLHVGQVSLQTVQRVCGFANAGSVWVAMNGSVQEQTQKNAQQGREAHRAVIVNLLLVVRFRGYIDYFIKRYNMDISVKQNKTFYRTLLQ